MAKLSPSLLPFLPPSIPSPSLPPFFLFSAHSPILPFFFLLPFLFLISIILQRTKKTKVSHQRSPVLSSGTPTGLGDSEPWFSSRLYQHLLGNIKEMNFLLWISGPPKSSKWGDCGARSLHWRRMLALHQLSVFGSNIMVRTSLINYFAWYIYNHSCFLSLHPQKKPQKKHVDGEWRARSYLAVPPSAATSETSRSSGSLADWGCKFYVWTSVLALAPVLHTTARSSKTSVFHYLIILFAINNINSRNPFRSVKTLFFPPSPPVFIFFWLSVEEKKYYPHLIMLTLFTIIYNIILQLSVIYTYTHIFTHIFYTDGWVDIRSYILKWSDSLWLKKKALSYSTACSDFYANFCCFSCLHNHTLWVTMAVYVDFVSVKASFKLLRTKW